jgi:hypothetical protein
MAHPSAVKTLDGVNIFDESRIVQAISGLRPRANGFSKLGQQSSAAGS